MEKPTNCPQSGHPMKEKQKRDGSGSFWGCSGYPECKFIWKNPLTPPATYTPRPSKTEQITAFQNNKAKLIEEAQDRKSNSVNIFNAMNSAISLVCHHPFYQNIKDEKELLMVIYSLQTEFYKHNSKQDNFPAF